MAYMILSAAIIIRLIPFIVNLDSIFRRRVGEARHPLGGAVPKYREDSWSMAGLSHAILC